MKKNMIFVLILNLLIACSPADREIQFIEQALIGTWSMDHILINEDIEINPIMSNLISFGKNGKLSFPGAEEIDWIVEKEENEQFFLDLNGIDKRYSFRLLVSFETDEKDKLLKLFLQSEKIEILSSKMLFDYDRNIQMINNLTELTNYN